MKSWGKMKLSKVYFAWANILLTQGTPGHKMFAVLMKIRLGHHNVVLT